MLRSGGFAKILERVPEGVIRPNHNFIAYKELHEENEVEIEFEGGYTCRADILVAADGIRSGVARQAFGDPQLFHTGIRVYLAWCDQLPDIPPACGALYHSREHQASFFPMLHDGKAGYEWWLVEPSCDGKPLPSDIEAHVRNILGTFADPLPRFADATNFDTQVYRWEVYNRPSLKKWSAGRVVGLGDAVHPVSPYAAYGMGMAIEDGYYLARSLESVDLRDIKADNAGSEIFRSQSQLCQPQCRVRTVLGKVLPQLAIPSCLGPGSGIGLYAHLAVDLVQGVYRHGRVANSYPEGA